MDEIHPPPPPEHPHPEDVPQEPEAPEAPEAPASSLVPELEPAATPPEPSPEPAFPNVQLDCGRAVKNDATFTPEEEMERAKVVMQSSPRMPAVGFYGPRYGEKWHVDLVALTHNAVRRQLFDAFTIANALGNVALDVSQPDLDRVYAWLGTLYQFVEVVFRVEDLFMYPLVDSNIKKVESSTGGPVYFTELLSVRGRKNAKEMVLDLLDTARKTKDVSKGETMAKIHALRYALDQFGANILDYFAAVEKFVPKLFKKTLRNGPKEKLRTEKKLFEHMLAQTHGAMLASLLLQCVENKTKRAEFVKRNIRKERDRVSFREHVKNVESTHMVLARAFDDVAGRYERRFSVSTFLQHYDAGADGQMTLAMLGDVDINAEGTGGEYEPEEGETRGDALDDDVIEVTLPQAT